MQQPSEHQYIEAGSSEAQSVFMMRNFASLTSDVESVDNKQAQHLALLTQQLLGTYWEAVV